jgi:DNA-directed RNA polymerase specialized sigma24 family protein
MCFYPPHTEKRRNESHIFLHIHQVQSLNSTRYSSTIPSYMTVGHDRNIVLDPDLQLLLKDPTQLIINYQEMVKIIVRKYASSGMFRYNDVPDIVQTVNAELWARLPRIQSNYDGRALVRTYISAIVRNICLKLRGKNTLSFMIDQNTTEDVLSTDVLPDRYSIMQVKVLFKAVLIQFDNHLPRLLLCLKLRFRIPVSRDDILQWHPECTAPLVESLLHLFGADYSSMKVKEIYALFTPILNSMEKKRNSDDALRKWTASKLQEIADLLNANIQGGSFDEETVRILFEDFISPFLLEE